MLLSVDSTHTVYLKGKQKEKWEAYCKKASKMREQAEDGREINIPTRPRKKPKPKAEENNE